MILIEVILHLYTYKNFQQTSSMDIVLAIQFSICYLGGARNYLSNYTFQQWIIPQNFISFTLGIIFNHHQEKKNKTKQKWEKWPVTKKFDQNWKNKKCVAIANQNQKTKQHMEYPSIANWECWDSSRNTAVPCQLGLTALLQAPHCALGEVTVTRTVAP